MDKVSIELTVFFDGQFWMGVFESTSENKLCVCRTVFGAEPKDGEVYNFIIGKYYKLKYSPAVAAVVKGKIKNPKRLRREIRKAVENNGIGTKSQQALKIQQEQAKLTRKSNRHEKNMLEKYLRFNLKQLKRKEKHKGH